MSGFGYGQMNPWDTNSEFNRLAFVIRQMMDGLETMRLVSVQAVHGGGESAGPPTVDVLPLVNQIDGNNNPVKHGVVNGVRCFRLQGSAGAIICDPQAGDIGYVLAASRDSSLVTAATQVNPGSRRTFDLADGIYVGGLLGDAPTQRVVFTSTGIKIVDKNGNMITTNAAGITITDSNANQIQMKPGIVNIITGVFQVNGVPVTVP